MRWWYLRGSETGREPPVARTEAEDDGMACGKLNRDGEIDIVVEAEARAYKRS